MTDKELIKKLNNLKNVNPDADWLAGNRDLLLSQISNSGARELSGWQIFRINFNSFAQAASKPMYALGAFILILIGSVFSHQIFSNAKPNDSLYIARIISEKAKLNTILDSEERNKLAVQFATEHAQDISAVLADPEFNNENNQDQVAKLNDSFNKEIDSAKTRISYLGQKNQKAAESSQAEDTEAIVSMANSEKDGAGVQIYEDQEIQNDNQATASVAATDTLNIIAEDKTAGMAASSTADAGLVLDEARELFENKDYDKASDKLKEVDKIIKD